MGVGGEYETLNYEAKELDSGLALILANCVILEELLYLFVLEFPQLQNKDLTLKKKKKEPSGNFRAEQYSN